MADDALARLTGLSGPAATEQFARPLDQPELRALGAWRNPRIGQWIAPSDSTVCRVMANTDPDALEAVLHQWAAPRAPDTGAPPALAADGKRLRGINRHSDDPVYFETVTLTTHDGHPLASRCCRDEGGELAATKALIEDVAVEGCLITLDVLHTTYDTEQVIVDVHQADYLFTVKGKPPETYALLKSLDWTAPTVRSDHTAPEKGHGRIEVRHLDAVTLPERWVRFQHARQAMRITRERSQLNTGETTTEIVYALTSVPAERADPKQLLTWNRGHWAVEMNHYRRDVSLGEDASRLRARQ